MQSLKGLPKSVFATDKDIELATAPIGEHMNKHSRGEVLVFCNSFEKQGAPRMAAYAANCALAALRGSTGYVTIIARKETLEKATARSPAYTMRRLGGVTANDIKTVAGIRHKVLVVGPGMWYEDKEAPFVRKLVALENKMGNTIVVDASAIQMVTSSGLGGSNMILTPNAAEFRWLTGTDLNDADLGTRIEAAKRFVNKYGCTLVMKGHETIIACRGKIKVNAAKTPALATLGSGDVLCGLIAGYAAQHGDAFESAVAGVHAHSMIGDMLFKKKGMHIIATDVIDAIPDALKRFDVIKR